MNRLVDENELNEIKSVLGSDYTPDLQFRIVSLEPYNSMKYCIDNTGSYLIRLTSKSKQNTTLKPKLMATSIDNDGYVRTAYELPLHRLVAQAFLEDFDPQLTVDHIFPDKLNNNVNNLQMLTRLENVRKFFTDPVHEADRLKAIEKMSRSKKGKHYGPRSPLSEEAKKKLSLAKKGKPCPQETRHKLSELEAESIIATNGSINIRVYKGQPIPEGFKRGRTLSQSNLDSLKKLAELNRGKKRTDEQKSSIQNRVWVTNGTNNKWIDKSQLDTYLKLGYVRGRSGYRKKSHDEGVSNGY